jgi:hypothetical protein
MDPKESTEAGGNPIDPLAPAIPCLCIPDNTVLNSNNYTLKSLQMVAMVRAMREELPAVPTAIAEIVGQYMASRDWEEAGTRLLL